MATLPVERGRRSSAIRPRIPLGGGLAAAGEFGHRRPSGVAFDIWPAVFGYTSVSSTRMLNVVAAGQHVVEAP